MIRGLVAILALAGAAACGRSQGSQDFGDQDLGGLVVAPKAPDQKIDVALAAREPSELGRALMLPYKAEVAAFGPHTVAVATTNTVDEGSAHVSDLSDQTTVELGDAGTYHATYDNSADYGREAIYVPSAAAGSGTAAGTLYLRPRYQRWHARAPETPDEPVTLRDQYLEAVGATWDLLAPAVELTDGGPATVAGRAGKKIIVKRAPTPRANPPEPLKQRAWRQTRSIDAVDGEIVIDAETGLPLSVKLSGAIGFQRAGRRFVMKLGVSSMIDHVGHAAAIVAPAAEVVVATPVRRREVDDRDFLLQNIAPPLRRNSDGTAVAPQPTAAPAAPATGSKP
jgi:hypothetical protein